MINNDLPMQKEFYGQAHQDKFVLNILKFKKNGYFLEIGAYHPYKFSNTFLLERKYDWKGIMIERDPQFLKDYKKERPNSIYLIQDATQIDYKQLLLANNSPKNIDFLQIDLDEHNGSTLKTLEKLDKEIMNDGYKFATITFEHDFYTSNKNNTRALSREIFLKQGYKPVFYDVSNNNNPFEDWYIHPELIDDIDYINQLKEKNQKNYIHHEGRNINTIEWNKIEY